MNAAASFIPDAEGAGGNVVPDDFGGDAGEGKFPIVNGAGAVSREMREPVAFQETADNWGRAIFYQVGPEDEHDGRFARAGLGDLPGASANERQIGGRAGRWAGLGIDQNILQARQAVALGKRQHF